MATLVMWRFTAIAILLLISTGPVEARRVDKVALKAHAHAPNKDAPLLKLAPEAGSFVCPDECQECCQQVISWSVILGRQDKTAFKCVMPKESIPGFKIIGRKCDPATPRGTDSSLGESKCYFTMAEQAHEFQNQLEVCK